MQKITPFLWFDSEAEEAMNFYVSLFPNSRVINVQRQGDQVFGIEFEINGQVIRGMNAGPEFKFNEAISFFVPCQGQEEVDKYWNSILENGGEESMCGWIKDKWSLWWQIVPKELEEGLSNPDPETAKRVTDAMLKMKKIIVADIENAKKNQS